MPHVIVKLYPGRSEEQRKRLARTIAQDVVAIVQRDEKSVSVAFEEIDPLERGHGVSCPRGRRRRIQARGSSASTGNTCVHERRFFHEPARITGTPFASACGVTILRRFRPLHAVFRCVNRPSGISRIASSP